MTYRNGIHLESEPGWKQYMKDKAEKAKIADMIRKERALSSKARSYAQQAQTARESTKKCLLAYFGVKE